MFISDSCIEKVTTKIHGSTRTLKAYLIGPVKNPDGNDLLNQDLDKIFKNTNQVIVENAFIELVDGSKYNCCYHDLAGIWNNTIKLSYYNLSSDERLFLFTNIRSEDEKRVFFRAGGRNSRLKLWLNNGLIFNGNANIYDDEFLTLDLQKGDNLVIIECNRINFHDEMFHITIRINDWEKEFNDIGEKLLKDYLNSDIKKMYCVQKSLNLCHEPEFEFMVIPKDFISLEKANRFSITVIGYNDNVYEEFGGEFIQRIKYDIDKIRNQNKDEIFLTFKIVWNISQYESYRIQNTILIKNFPEVLKNIHSNYSLILSHNTLSQEDRLNIETRIEMLENKSYISIENPQIIKRELKVITDFLAYQKNDYRFENFIMQKRGAYTYYYISSLDNRPEIFNIYIPKYYSNEKKYPLLIFIPTGRYSDMVFFYEKIIDDDVILVEITCKGVNGGSYIGEASFLEGLNKILKLFNIDQDRIYLAGESNGAYAAWALAQSHPYLFAAIVTVAGEPYMDNLLNVSNINILNIGGDKDTILENSYMLPSKLLLKHVKDYEGILLKDSLHNSCLFTFHSKYIITWLLKHKREHFPQKIYFRTERIRHNKTHWIDINRMDINEKYCQLKGEIKDSSTIELEIKNIEHFTLHLQKNMIGRKVNIKINSADIFTIDILQADKLYFERKDNSFILTDNISCIQKNSQGMGILDIFMDSLVIIVPSQYCNKEENETIRSLAKSYSTPHTRGWDPYNYVFYPIIAENELSKNCLYDKNIILIGNSTSTLFSKIKHDLPIKLLENSYCYKNDHFEGHYCILLICTSPYNKKRKLLMIYSNNYELYNRCFFTRKLVIPFYANGSHPFLNNEAIIFDGKDYYFINTIGSEISKYKV